MHKYINVRGRLLDLSEPKVMAIVNLTPDSFYAQSRAQTEEDILKRVDEALLHGADIIDIGAYSSRPNATHISSKEEMDRLSLGLDIIRRRYPDVVISIDTFRSEIARQCVKDYEVDIINDISGGEMDKDMFNTIAKLQVPYVIMHMKGTPQNMQTSPHYDNVVREVFMYFAKKTAELKLLGVNDVILDLGFGFGKTVEHNYSLMRNIGEFQIFDMPLLVGVSRKSMIYKLLDINPEEALNGTTALHTYSLLNGANILRVHDVKEAVETIKITKAIMNG